jgi:hypothetical protein
VHVRPTAVFDPTVAWFVPEELRRQTNTSVHVRFVFAVVKFSRMVHVPDGHVVIPGSLAADSMPIQTALAPEPATVNDCPEAPNAAPESSVLLVVDPRESPEHSTLTPAVAEEAV